MLVGAGKSRAWALGLASKTRSLLTAFGYKYIHPRPERDDANEPHFLGDLNCNARRGLCVANGQCQGRGPTLHTSRLVMYPYITSSAGTAPSCGTAGEGWHSNRTADDCGILLRSPVASNFSIPGQRPRACRSASQRYSCASVRKEEQKMGKIEKKAKGRALEDQ